MTSTALRAKLEQLAERLLDDGLALAGIDDIKDKTTALKTAADVYALLHKQDASGKGASAYDGYRDKLAAAAASPERKAGNGSGRGAYRGDGPSRQ